MNSYWDQSDRRNIFSKNHLILASLIYHYFLKLYFFTFFNHCDLRNSTCLLHGNYYKPINHTFAFHYCKVEKHVLKFYTYCFDLKKFRQTKILWSNSTNSIYVLHIVCLFLIEVINLCIYFHSIFSASIKHKSIKIFSYPILYYSIHTPGPWFLYLLL